MRAGKFFSKPAWRYGALILGVIGLGLSGMLVIQALAQTRFELARERTWPELVKALEEKGMRAGAPVFFRIFKESKELEAWVRKDGKFELFNIYPVCNYGGQGIGPKLQQGDGMAPEGFYTVARGQMNPQSKYHLAFNLGYPNAFDRWHKRTGSALMVHGECVSIGCYAITNPCIEEIYTLADAALAGGQRAFSVHVFPFRMTEENMARHKGHRWEEFWGNLKEGYDLFEKRHVPPRARVREGRYVFDLKPGVETPG
jgi:murein L,D-transpeptidase YafK